MRSLGPAPEPEPAPSPPAPRNGTAESPAAAHRRFIGDLNPESVFFTHSTTPPRDDGECGVWASEHSNPSAGPPPGGARSTAVSAPLHAYLLSLGAYVLPKRSSRKALVDLYLEAVHPLLPLLNVPPFLAAHAAGSASLPLLHAVLLVAARHPLALPHIAPLPPRRFAAQQETKIRALLHANVETDRLTLTRIYVLLGLHSEGPGGNEAASLALGNAMHYAHGLGLHLSRCGREEEAEGRRLWWCLWGLDGLQAAVCGRPVLMRLEDVGVRYGQDEAGFGEGFMGWLKLAGLLTEVIGLYRPGSEGHWEGEFPPFEQLIGSAGRCTEAETVTLQVFYHAIRILSHRSRSSTIPTASSFSASFHRRIDSATQILALLQKPPSNAPPLPPLPVIPYAASLALTTFYASLRSGTASPSFHASYTASIQVLESLEPYWWSAGAMARLGREAHKSIETRQAAVVLGSIAHSIGPPSQPPSIEETWDSQQHRSHPTAVAEAEQHSADDSAAIAATAAAAASATAWQDQHQQSSRAATPTGGMESFLQLFPDLAQPTGFLDQWFWDWEIAAAAAAAAAATVESGTTVWQGGELPTPTGTGGMGL